MATMQSKESLIQAAKDAGNLTGAYVARLKFFHEQDVKTIKGAAIVWVNRLPLNDIEFEKELEAIFVTAALGALTQTKGA